MTALHTGDQLDHYRIETLVARSGMASIFRATDLCSGKPIALKIPHPEVESDPVFYDRFHREQDIGTKLDHPGVMKVLDDGDRTQVYMAMEWVEGACSVKFCEMKESCRHFALLALRWAFAKRLNTFTPTAWFIAT
jgi:serine/threonine-protein kinase